MGLFSSSKSNVTNQTTNNLTDQSANAGGDGSIAIGSGVTINDLSESVANNAIGANEAVARAAIENATKQTEFVTNTVLGMSERSASENADVRVSADRAIQQANSLVSALTAQAGSALERAQAPDAASVKALLTPILMVLGAVLVVFVIFGRGNNR